MTLGRRARIPTHDEHSTGTRRLCRLDRDRRARDWGAAEAGRGHRDGSGRSRKRVRVTTRGWPYSLKARRSLATCAR